MNGLHRGSDAEFGKARDIGRIEMLGMLDAPAQITFLGVLAKNTLVEVEDLAIGAVPDGMDAEVEAVVDGDFGGLADVGDILGIEAAIVGSTRGQIGVGLEEPGAARAERTVHLALDGADGKMIVREADHFVLPDTRLEEWVGSARQCRCERPVACKPCGQRFRPGVKPGMPPRDAATFQYLEPGPRPGRVARCCAAESFVRLPGPCLACRAALLP